MFLKQTYFEYRVVKNFLRDIGEYRIDKVREDSWSSGPPSQTFLFNKDGISIQLVFKPDGISIDDSIHTKPNGYKFIIRYSPQLDFKTTNYNLEFKSRITNHLVRKLIPTLTHKQKTNFIFKSALTGISPTLKIGPNNSDRFADFIKIKKEIGTGYAYSLESDGNWYIWTNKKNMLRLKLMYG